jgi:hypothetical protein
MSVFPRYKGVALMIDYLAFEALVARVFTLATTKANELARGEEFEITLQPDDIPDGLTQPPGGLTGSPNCNRSALSVEPDSEMKKGSANAEPFSFKQFFHCSGFN